jgi:hypothetical protein
MTPEHKFELLRTVISIIPATALSAWALIHQRRQTRARLDVLMSPLFTSTVDSKGVLTDSWPGVAVRNQSTFPLRICSVGYCIGKKFYAFDEPLNNVFTKFEEWPSEISPRSRVAFYPGPAAERNFRVGGLYDIKRKKVWEVGRAYVMTECNKLFLSPKMSQKTLRLLRKADPLKDMTAVS